MKMVLINVEGGAGGCDDGGGRAQSGNVVGHYFVVMRWPISFMDEGEVDGRQRSPAGWQLISMQYNAWCAHRRIVSGTMPNDGDFRPFSTSEKNDPDTSYRQRAWMISRQSSVGANLGQHFCRTFWSSVEGKKTHNHHKSRKSIDRKIVDHVSHACRDG